MSLKLREFEKIVHYVEVTLGDYYGFDPQMTALAHIVTRKDLQDHFGESVRRLPEYESRAGVYLYNDAVKEELFIGMHVDEKVQLHLEGESPLTGVTRENIDSFWVLIEEVSHFHLLINRISQNRGVSKLELEWQGEIDKLLVAALTLRAQSGDPCLKDLISLLHEHSDITAHKELKNIYEEANRYAARFWHRTLKSRRPLGDETKGFLRDSYWVLWNEKKSRLVGLGT